MIVFEILFKNAFILQTPSLVVMHSLNEKGSPKLSYAKSVFNSCRFQLVSKFARFSVLENLNGVSALRQSSDHPRISDENRSRDEDSESVGAESVESALSEEGIVNKIRQGIFAVEVDQLEAVSNNEIRRSIRELGSGKAMVHLPEFQTQKGFFVSFPSEEIAQICLFDMKRLVLIYSYWNGQINIYFPDWINYLSYIVILFSGR